MQQARTAPKQDVASTWVFWVAAIEQPDAHKLVNGINGAMFALNRILEHGFPQDEMEQWLGEWPTELGRTRFQRAGGAAGSTPSDG